MASKKKKEKTWEEIEKEQYANEEYAWVWDEVDHFKMVQYFRRFCCHMISTGLEMKGEPEEKRMERLEAIMESEEWEMSEDEMLEWLPDSIIEEELEIKSIKHGTEHVMTELQFAELCNKLAERGVYKMMADLEKQGLLKLCWNDELKDFTYMPVDPDDDWKRGKK